MLSRMLLQKKTEYYNIVFYRLDSVYIKTSFFDCNYFLEVYV